MKAPAMLIDITQCAGCERCVRACKREHNLGPDRAWRQSGRIDNLSATRYTTIIRKPEQRFVRQQCRHCLKPACVSACLVGAMRQAEDGHGPVVYDKGKCMGCRYCMVACPYGIPRYDWNEPVPYVRKCTMCFERISTGKRPACADACQIGATTFGSRGAMLTEARKRLKQEPKKYIQRVYGEDEVGGASVLYTSDIPLGFLGFKSRLNKDALPDLTWAALSKVPPMVVGMGGLMLGAHWIIKRRMKTQYARQTTKSAVQETRDETKENKER